MADYSSQATTVGRFLAIAHLFLGFILVCFGIADYATTYFFTGYICLGIWIGIWMGVTGILGVLGTRKERTTSRDTIGAIFMGFSITSAVFGGIIIIFYSISISTNSDDYYRYYGRSRNSRYEGEMAISGIILFIGILEFFMGIWAAICCCLMKVCSCCYSNQFQQGQMMQPVLTYGHGGPVAVPMQAPGGLVASETDSQFPQGGQPQVFMVPASGAIGGQPLVMQMPPADASMPTAPVSQGVEMAESAGHGKYMALNNEQV